MPSNLAYGTKDAKWASTVQILARFLKTKLRDQTFQHPPLHPGAEEVPLAKSKIGVYSSGRNHVDKDGTSHIS